MSIRSAGYVGVLATIGVLFPVNAHAYLDPGTGSIILQGLLAAIAAGSLAVKMYWRRIVALVRGKEQPAQQASLLDDMDDASRTNEVREESNRQR